MMPPKIIKITQLWFIVFYHIQILKSIFLTISLDNLFTSTPNIANIKAILGIKLIQKSIQHPQSPLHTIVYCSFSLPIPSDFLPLTVP